MKFQPPVFLLVCFFKALYHLLFQHFPLRNCLSFRDRLYDVCSRFVWRHIERFCQVEKWLWLQELSWHVEDIKLFIGKCHEFFLCGHSQISFGDVRVNWKLVPIVSNNGCSFSNPWIVGNWHGYHNALYSVSCCILEVFYFCLSVVQARKHDHCTQYH